MKGNVEVFAVYEDGSEELIISQPNLVVNGAGESIVDMLTTPSSVLGISPRVMDTSNWRFGALSFGPPAGAFSGNAYFYPEDQVYMKTDDLCNGVSSSVSSLINQISTDKKLRILWASSTIGESNGATASSYTPPYRVPSYPDPLNGQLEDASTSYSIVSGDASLQSYGQFENRIHFNVTEASSYFQGAYPRYSAIGEMLAGMIVSSYDATWSSETSAHMVAFEEATSKYNQKNSMDYRGFISTVYNAPDMATTSNYLGRVYVSGSVVAGLTGATSQVAQPKVTVTTKIAKGDLWAMNVYGGLHQVGLWNMDTPRALLSNEAPFLEGDPDAGGDTKFINTMTGVTKQEYKLFAKKTFTNDLTHIKDVAGVPGFSSYVGLKLQWTLDLRSDHD